MRLHKNYSINKLRCIASQSNVGRSGLAEETVKAIDKFDGTYKGAMELAGKLSIIANASTFDQYWMEQVQRGINKMESTFNLLEDKKQ